MSFEAREQPLRAVPFILAGCTAISVLSTDLITPSIPSLPDAFETPVNTAQMVVSVNLLAYAFAQLVHGPVADRYGRRALLLVGLGLFVLASAFCALAASIDMLLAGRFLQGLFSSVPSVVIVLMIRELYQPRDALNVMTLYGAALGIAPAMGPLLGGYLHVWFGWSAGFWMIAVLAILAAWAVWRYVPESLEEPQPLHAGRALKDYAALLRNGPYLRTTLAVSLTFGAFFAYVTTAPVIFIDIIGLATQHYGLTNILIVAAFVLGNVVAGRLRNRVGTLALLSGAIVIAMLAMLGLLGGVMLSGAGIWLILGPMTVYALALAFILAAGPLVVLNRAKDMPQGPAAALLGSLQLAASAGAGYLSARLYDGSALTMILVMAVAVFIGGLCLLWQLSIEEVEVTG